MIQLIKRLLGRGSRLFPGVTSATYFDGQQQRGINIDDERFNDRIAVMLTRVERAALDTSPSSQFTFPLDTEELDLYYEDPEKFMMITQLQLIKRMMMVTIMLMGFKPGPPVTMLLMRGGSPEL